MWKEFSLNFVERMIYKIFWPQFAPDMRLRVYLCGRENDVDDGKTKTAEERYEKIPFPSDPNLNQCQS